MNGCQEQKKNLFNVLNAIAQHGINLIKLNKKKRMIIMKMEQQTLLLKNPENALRMAKTGLNEGCEERFIVLELCVKNGKKLRNKSQKFTRKICTDEDFHGLSMDSQLVDLSWTYHGLIMDWSQFMDYLWIQSIERERESKSCYGLYMDYIGSFGVLLFSKVMDLVHNQSTKKHGQKEL